jgi:phosphopantothenoylcysteine synthetase/decarboxylase
MNVAMYNSPAVKRNLEILRGFEDTTVLESPAGELACGAVGQGRLMEPAEIVAFLETKDERRKTKDFVSRSISSRQQSHIKFSGVNLAKTGREVPFLL